MISKLRNTDHTDTNFAVKPAIAAEQNVGPARILSREEIEALNAQGAFTDPRRIPKDHGFKRVSVPRSRRCRVL